MFRKQTFSDIFRQCSNPKQSFSDTDGIRQTKSDISDVFRHLQTFSDIRRRSSTNDQRKKCLNKIYMHVNHLMLHKNLNPNAKPLVRLNRVPGFDVNSRFIVPRLVQWRAMADPRTFFVVFSNVSTVLNDRDNGDG